MRRLFLNSSSFLVSLPFLWLCAATIQVVHSVAVPGGQRIRRGQHTVLAIARGGLSKTGAPASGRKASYKNTKASMCRGKGRSVCEPHASSSCPTKSTEHNIFLRGGGGKGSKRRNCDDSGKGNKSKSMQKQSKSSYSEPSHVPFPPAPTVAPSARPTKEPPAPFAAPLGMPSASPSTETAIASGTPSVTDMPSASPSSKEEPDCWNVIVASSTGMHRLNTQDFTLQTILPGADPNNPITIGFRGDELWGQTPLELELKRYDAISGAVTRTLRDPGNSFLGLGTDPVSLDLVGDVFDDSFTGTGTPNVSISRIDTGTGSSTEIATISHFLSGDIASFGGKIYASVVARSFADNDELIQINPERATSTIVGTLPSNTIWGLTEVGIAGGTTQLWGFDSVGDVYNININGNTLRSDLLGNIGIEVYDAASVPC